MEYTGIPAQSAHALPSQPEAERSVLGAMLRSADAVMLAQESLKEDDFYDPILREIFSARFRAWTCRPLPSSMPSI